jgi:hypothetical protein
MFALQPIVPGRVLAALRLPSAASLRCTTRDECARPEIDADWYEVRESTIAPS